MRLDRALRSFRIRGGCCVRACIMGWLRCLRMAEDGVAIMDLAPARAVQSRLETSPKAQ